MSDLLGVEYLKNVIMNMNEIKSKAEQSFSQVTDYNKFSWIPNGTSNNLSILIRHFSGNMKSRWTDFLTTDGEKESRKRDEEFDETLNVKRETLMEDWDAAWEITLVTLSNLDVSDLLNTIYIRNEAHTVLEAINRQLLHLSGHLAQIIFLCKLILDKKWKTLSIPKKNRSV